MNAILSGLRHKAVALFIINNKGQVSLHLQEEVAEVRWIDKDEIIRRIENNYDEITDKKDAWSFLLKYYREQEKKEDGK